MIYKAMTAKGSTHTKTMQRFQAAFKKWFDSSGMSQIEASILFETSQALVSKLLKCKGSVTIALAEKIATKVGKDLPEMLIEGREILGEKYTSSQANQSDPNQTVKDAFDYVLSQGGESAEILIDLTIRLAQKKQAEADLQNPTSATRLSNSA